MRILLSAFACDPNHGSEPGVGWAWASHLARSGHDVCVLTRERFRIALENEVSKTNSQNLRFIFVDVNRVPYQTPALGTYPYYFAWQFKLYLKVARLVRKNRPDCIHHITYASYRTPFLLSLLGVPSIFGPVGGGEASPMALTRGMSFSARARELGRHVARLFRFLNPITTLVWRHSTLILLTTEETLRMVPAKYHPKCRVLPAVTTPSPITAVNARRRRTDGTLRVLFVGRILEWKGLHLALPALKIARRRVPGIHLTIVGDGESKPRIQALVEAEGQQDAVEWISRIPRRQVLELYGQHELLVFPSLHDSGGTVILEAFSYGMPVICLNLGGPGVLVDSSCGASIDTNGQSFEQVVDAIADELVRFSRMSDPEEQAIREAAFARAQQFSLGRVAGQAYAWFAEMQGATPSPK
jgi:glycosyltransferase involved in cell wall biosynthesis